LVLVGPTCAPLGKTKVSELTDFVPLDAIFILSRGVPGALSHRASVWLVGHQALEGLALGAPLMSLVVICSTCIIGFSMLL